MVEKNWYDHSVTSEYGLKVLSFRSGMYLFYSKAVFLEDFCHDSKLKTPMLEIAYQLEGSSKSVINDKEIEIRRECSHIGFSRQLHSYSDYKQGDTLKLVSIWLNPQIFDECLMAVDPQSRLNFWSFLGESPYFFAHEKMDEQEKRILFDIVKSFEQTPCAMNRLYIESKMLEIISMKLPQLLGKSTEQCKVSTTKEDRQKMQMARDILLERLDYPPSLLELARMVGTNDYKLKTSFKEMFGTTVFGYVREQRLEKALHLMTSGACNVSESAYAVGYSNLSHFSAAFKERYGVNPREVVGLGQRRNV